LPNPTAAPKLNGGENEDRVVFAVSRDYEPVPGQWYQNVEEEESFRVLSVDEDSERLEIEYLDGDIEEIDLEAWREMDLERIEEPEGWSESDDEEAEGDDDWDEEDEEDDDDDDWDEDEDDVDDERDEY
jgi:hypothetical protein